MRSILLLALAAVSVSFILVWRSAARRARAARAPDEHPQAIYHSLVSIVMCFFDTLGIGNFAPTTSMFKLNGAILRSLGRVLEGVGLRNVIVPPATFEPGNSVRDEWIPGTLNVGYALPTVAEALIYISLVEVEAPTLVLLIAASVVGAWFGAGVVSRWPRRKIQIGMGFALLGAATLMALTALKIAPGGGEALTLTGWRLWAGFSGNLALGALMTLGIGLYGPCLILVSLLGMDPRAAFPIMMGSCAFLMPIGGMRFIREGRYSRKVSFIMTLAGIPPVLLAAYVVKQMELDYLRWLVVAVVFCTAIMMLRAALAGRNRSAEG
jgi:uncharacterized membrane protein YfcA